MPCASAQYRPDDPKPPMLQDIGLDQRLNQQVPLDLVFRDEGGREVKLGDYFGHKPVVLNLAYFTCPMLCNEVMTGMTSALGAVSFTAGRDFTIVTVSIDPQDTTESAAAKRDFYLRRYHRAGADAGWHFLTGDEANIRALADAVGFRYKYDAASRQFAHASGIMVLTPQGRLARYFYGIEYPPRDLKLGLMEASQGRIGSVVDQVLLFCYHYDPGTGKYTPVVMNLVRAGGVLTLLALGTFIVVMVRRDSQTKTRGRAA
ncbi:MAG TPA: SCO family protein [Terriglobales bacterium]|nr:SCO family protein [Terriglobales bacterium]